MRTNFTLMGRTVRGALIAGLIATACSDPTEPPNGSWSTSDTWAGQIVITENAGSPHWPSDAVTIEGVVIKGDSLELAVNFGGGCRDHSFMLLSDAVWLESYPVQVGVYLKHDANGDACKALLSRVLRFDLTPLKARYASSYQASTGSIRLNLRVISASPVYSW